MKKAVLLIIFILYKLNLNAQADFNGLLGACKDDYARDMVELTDGTKYILSSTKSYLTDGYEHILITKLDSNNNEVWSKIFYGGSDDIGYSIKNNNQKIIISGTTRRTINGVLTYKTFVMQLDTSGQVNWSNTYNDGLVYSMDICKNNDIILTGEIFEPFERDKIFVLKIDSIGNVKWSRVFFSVDNSEGQSIILTSDNSILASGSLGYGSNGYDKPVLIKLDLNGNIIWMYYYVFNNSHYYYKLDKKSNVIELSVDSTFILSGTSVFSPDWISYLLNINSLNGDIIWNKTYDLGYNDYITGVFENNNNLYIYGNETYTDTSLTGNIQWSYDYVIINTNLQGDINWAKTYGCLNEDIISKLSKFNNKIYLSGSSTNFYGVNVSLTASDSYLSEITLDGHSSNILDSLATVNVGSMGSVNKFSDFNSNIITVLSTPVIFSDTIVNSVLDSSFCEPLFVNNSFIDDKIEVFPNPNNGIFTVNVKENYSFVSIYNLFGQIIFEQNFNKQNIEIDISAFETGLYLLKINLSNKEVITRKILKE